MDIKAPCDRTYHAVHSSGERSLNLVTMIVLHSEEAGTAKSAAMWFTNPDSQGSAHLCVDDNICYRTLGNDEIPWAAPGANTNGFHIEMPGFARWNQNAWILHRNTLKRAAYKTALHCRLFGIPTKFLSA